MSSPATDTRTRILEAAWRLMEERQGRGVRMTDIAKAAGISRQALYLHFDSRTALLVATARHGDEVRGLDRRLEPWRTATSGPEMLDALIAFWGGYLPEIYGLAKALLSVLDTDDDAAEAWRDRMGAIRGACSRTIDAVAAEEMLDPRWTRATATDVLWTLLSVRSWEQLTVECGWSIEAYTERMQALARSTLIRRDAG